MSGHEDAGTWKESEERWKTVQLMGIVENLYSERLALVRHIVHHEAAWTARTGRVVIFARERARVTEADLRISSAQLMIQRRQAEAVRRLQEEEQVVDNVYESEEFEEERKKKPPQQHERDPSKAEYEPQLIDSFGAEGEGAGQQQLQRQQQQPQQQERDPSIAKYELQLVDSLSVRDEGAGKQQLERQQQLQQSGPQGEQQSEDCCACHDDKASPPPPPSSPPLPQQQSEDCCTCRDDRASPPPPPQQQQSEDCCTCREERGACPEGRTVCRGGEGNSWIVRGAGEEVETAGVTLEASWQNYLLGLLNDYARRWLVGGTLPPRKETRESGTMGTGGGVYIVSWGWALGRSSCPKRVRVKEKG